MKLTTLPVPHKLLAALATSVSLVGAANAQTNCSQWDPGSLKDILQDDGTHVKINLHATRAGIEGTSTYAVDQQGRGEVSRTDVDGEVTGVLDRDRIHVQITWGNGATGIYNGQITAGGVIREGVTFDAAHTGNRVGWHSARPLSCASAQAASVFMPSPPVPPHPLRPMGRSAARAHAADESCATGFVWRAARADDLVCVSPPSRDLVAEENRTAPQRWNPAGNYGPATCTPTFVWREAFAGDTVCVTPQRRDDVRQENQLGPSRHAAR